MKSLKTQFIGAIAMVLVAAIAMGSSTYAWFSMNKEVTAKGMTVKASTSSSLVIAATTLGSSGVGTDREITFNTAVQALIPADHYDSTTYPTSKFITTPAGNNYDLVYNTNPSVVDASSGYKAATAAEDLKFDYAANNASAGTYYFIDYVAYIAAAGSKMTGQDLNAKIVMDKTTYSGYAARDTRKAVSVDFYVADETISSGKKADSSINTDYVGTFMGTLDIHALDTTGANAESAALNLLSNGEIPKNQSTSDFIRVVMRVYFDGALDSGSSAAYVYSDSINTTDVGFSVLFTASDYSGA